MAKKVRPTPEAKRKCLAWLAARAHGSARSIANGVGYHPEYVRSALRELVESGEVRVVMPGSAYYGPALYGAVFPVRIKAGK